MPYNESPYAPRSQDKLQTDAIGPSTDTFPGHSSFPEGLQGAHHGVVPEGEKEGGMYLPYSLLFLISNKSKVTSTGSQFSHTT